MPTLSPCFNGVFASYAGVRNPPPSPPLRSPSSGGPARRVSEGDSDGDEFQDASEALASQPSVEASGRTI